MLYRMTLNLSIKPIYCKVLFKFFKFDTVPKMSTLRKVYVRHLEIDDTMKINFSFGSFGFPDRNFTFMRLKEETLETTLARMQLKILDAMTKKVKKKKREETITDESKTLPQINISLHKGNNSVDVNLKNIEAWTSSTELRINENIYQIIRNPPSVIQINLPKNIMAGFLVYPKVSLEFCSKDECEFTWYRLLSKGNISNHDNSEIIKIKGESWLFLTKNFFYLTNENDIGCRLKVVCLPKCKEVTGIEECAVSPSLVQMGPRRYPFEDRHEYTKELTRPRSFRCISYNILADMYADSDTARNVLFAYCPDNMLMVDYRKQLYLKEIMGYNGDIVCLQEVDRRIFHDDLIPVLTSTGLEGIYNEKGGQVVEGLSCFYRTSKFKLIETHAIILSDALYTEKVLQPMLAKIRENEKLYERVISRTTALQVVLLESTDTERQRILVGNTHLYFHPESDNIRLIQGASFLLYLENLLDKYRKENASYTTSLVLCGDFNSSPDCGIYKLMTKGKLTKGCSDWNSNPEEFVTGLPLNHSLYMDSACGTPEYTNYTEGFAGCLDYIYYEKSNLEVSEVVPFPTHEQVIKHKAIPSEVFPSDHIALICTLQWK